MKLLTVLLMAACLARGLSAAPITAGALPDETVLLDSSDPFGLGYKFTMSGVDYYWTNQPTVVEKDLTALAAVAGYTNTLTALSGTVNASNALFNAWFAGLFGRTNYWEGALQPDSTNGWEVGTHAGFLTNETDLAAMRLYHYGLADIVETDAAAFTFNPATGAITGYDYGIGGASVIIPWSIGGVDVTSVGDAVFYEAPILSAIGPKTLTSLGEAAFSLSSVVYVNLPGVLNVGAECFLDSQLKSLSLSSVTNLGNRALGYTPSLTSVYFYANSPTFGADVFEGSPNVVNYVTNPNATGWSSTFGGMPVVRLPLYADAVYQSGKLVADKAAFDGHVTDGVHTNVTLAGTVTIGGVARTDWPEGGTPGAVTNGQPAASFAGVTFAGSGSIDAGGGSISCQNVQPNNAVYFPAKGILMWATTAINDTGNAYTFADAGGENLMQVKASSVRVGATQSGSALIELSKTGEIKLGPIISTKQAHTFSDGTNLFFVNVNSVTNALTTN